MRAIFQKIVIFNLVLVSTLTASSQIIYTDLQPDLTADYTTNNMNDTVRIDIDNDNVMDAEFIAGISVVANDNLQGEIMHINGNHEVAADVYNDIIIGIPVSFNQALVYSAGQTIDGSLTYESNSVLGEADGLALYITSTLITAGHATTDDQDFYIGIKLDINGSTHYGWVLASVNSTVPKITIKSFAYNTAADAAIVAGATNNIQKSTEVTSAVYPNPFTNSVMLKNVVVGSKITVYRLDGKEITTFITGQDNVVLNTEDWINGTYILKVANDDSVYSFKVSKTH